jgi:hypothetical protein
MGPQLKRTKGSRDLGEALCTDSASRSLPVPVSPVMSTAESCWAMTGTRRRSFSMAGLRPTICPCPVAWDRRASISRMAVRSSTTSRTQTGRLLPSATRTGVMRTGILRR